MNLTNLVSLFLDIYKIYHKLSKFSLKTKLISIYILLEIGKQNPTARPNSSGAAQSGLLRGPRGHARCGPTQVAHSGAAHAWRISE